MRVITDNSSINDSGYNIATIGYFDGIHLGHKKILNELVGQAQKRNGKSILITFWPHPRNILKSNTSVELLLSNDDKHLFLKNIGIDYLEPILKIITTNVLKKIFKSISKPNLST